MQDKKKEDLKNTSRREFGKKLLGTAFAGLVAGAALTSNKIHADEKGYKHACKGLNVCKGKGADGKNECKGKGTCATVEKHACAGSNKCKGEGGCKTGDKGCAGKNTCKGKGGCHVPVVHDIKK